MSGIDRKQRQQVKSFKTLTSWQEKGKQPDNKQETVGLSGGELREHGQCA